MTEIITYRLSGTGIWVYEFYDSGRNKIGSVGSEIAPSSPTRIDGRGVSWYSRYNLDQTIVPGTGRQVKDSSTGSEVYRVIYWRPGLYQVRPEVGNSAQVEIRDGSYLFGPPEMPAVALTERITEAEWLPPVGKSVEPYFRTTVYEDDVSPAFLMMVLSFPALRFY